MLLYGSAFLIVFRKSLVLTENLKSGCGVVKIKCWIARPDPNAWDGIACFPLIEAKYAKEVSDK